MHRIGRYEIRRELGRGGFGRVYAAFDPTVARMVAIKTLTAVAEPDLLARFRNEASTAGQLRHSNIVTIHDFGEHEGSPYLVMELLDGEDLQSVIVNRRMLSAYDKLRILWEVADGLQHAHAHNIIHRDVKPANIMLVGGRHAKLLDFGIAFVTQATVSRLTPHGNMVGTYRYMAPEQFRGDAPDALADIFAYGLVFYELLTGIYPFESADAAGVMYRIMSTEPVPLREVCPEFPAPLDGVVSRILKKDREARYQNFDDLKFDLEPMLIEFRKERLAAVLAEAQMRLAADEMNAAQALVKEALDLDRGSPVARRLRDEMQREIQRRSVRPKLAALVGTADQKLTERRFDEAIRDLESALRLDSTNAGVLEKIQSVRARKELFRISEQHSDQAKRALRERNLTGALDHANEALLADPQNAAAAALLDEIRAELVCREQARRLLDLLGKARGMLLLGSYDEAIGLLEAAEQEFPDAVELRDLRLRAYADKSAHEREYRLSAEISAAKQMLKQRDFEAAHARLEIVQAEFPQTAELKDLLEYARDQWRHERDAQAAEQLMAEAQSLLNDDQFSAAIAILERTLDEHPGHVGVRQLLQRAAREKACAENRPALRPAHSDVTALFEMTRGPIAEQPRPAEVEVTTCSSRMRKNPGTDGSVHRPRPDLADSSLAVWDRFVCPRVSPHPPSVPAGDAFVRGREWRNRAYSYSRKFGAPLVTAALAVAATGIIATTQVRHQPSAPTMAAANVPPSPPVSPALPRSSRGPMNAPPRGMLVVSTRVPGVEVLLNGRKSGRTRQTPVPKPTEHPVPAPARMLVLPAAEAVNQTVPPRPELPPVPPNDWARLRETEDSAEIEEFLRRNIGTPLEAVATARLEQVLWMRVNKEDLGDLKRFLTRFQKGAMAPAATARISQLEKAATARGQADVIANRANLPREMGSNAEQEEIARTLRRYNEAFESRSMPQLGAIWPGMPRDTRESLRNAFKADDVRYTIRLEPAKPAEISGDLAVVECDRVARTVARGVSKPTQGSRVQVVLARTGKGWVVRSIRDAR